MQAPDAVREVVRVSEGGSRGLHNATARGTTPITSASLQPPRCQLVTPPTTGQSGTWPLPALMRWSLLVRGVRGRGCRVPPFIQLLSGFDGEFGWFSKLLVKSAVCTSCCICCVWWELSRLAEGLDALASQGKEQLSSHRSSSGAVHVVEVEIS